MDGGGNGAVLNEMAALPAARAAAYLAGEAPQTAAALLLMLPPGRAADVLAALPAAARRLALQAMVAARPLSAPVWDTVAAVLRDTLLTPANAVPADRRAEVLAIVESLPAPLRDEAAAALDAPFPPPPAPPADPPPWTTWTTPDMAPGLLAMINSTRISTERLPMMEVVVDRYVRMLSTSLRNALNCSVDVGLIRIDSQRFGDWMNGLEAGSRLLAPFRAQPWDHYGLLVLTRSAQETLVQTLMGGTAATAGLRVEGRPFTTIDRALAGDVLTLMLGDLAAAFAPIAPVALTLDRIEDQPRFVTIDRPCNGIFVIELLVSVEGVAGTVELILPWALLEPVRDALRQPFMGERFGHDPLWSVHLRGALAEASVPVQAVAGTAPVELGQMLGWAPGVLLVLASEPGWVVLETGGKPVAEGRLGIRNGCWAVSVDKNAVHHPHGSDAPHHVLTLPRRDEEGTAPAAAPPPDADPLEQVPVTVSVQIGEADMAMAALMALAHGAVVTLDRRVGEPVTVLAGGKPVARGELVQAAGGRWAVALTHVG